MKIRLYTLLLCWLLLVGITAAEDDHLEAYHLVEMGTILPLESILETVREQRSGYILEVELERYRESYLYVIELLDDAGIVWEVEIDAVTGKILKIAMED